MFLCVFKPYLRSKYFKNVFFFFKDHTFSSIDSVFIPLMHGVHYSGHICLFGRIFHLFKSKNKHVKNLLCDLIIHASEG